MSRSLNNAGVVVLILIFTTPAIQAEGIIHKLPEDGSWVEYAMEGIETDLNNPGDVKKLTGSILISSVGAESIDGENCRWVEFFLTLKQKNRKDEDQIIFKLLIPEKHLQRGKTPRENVIRGWVKISQGRQQGKILEISSKSQLKMIKFLLVGPLQKPEKLKPMVIETDKGKLKCDGTKGGFSFKETNGIRTDDFAGAITIRKQANVPFGVAFYKVDTKEPNGDKITLKLTLREYGKLAETELPDHN